MAEQLGNNWKPIVGQKVVALEGDPDIHIITKGQTYPVLAVNQCSCGRFSIDIGEPIPKSRSGAICGQCEADLDGGVRWIATIFFAPIQYEGNAIAEILSKFKPYEGKEVDVQPIKKEELV